MQATHPKLVWPRSDGSDQNWPKETTPRATPTWYEKLPLSDPKYKLYHEKIGAHLAKALNLPGRPESHKIPLPPGYALFGHHQPRDNGEIRVDAYMFGSKYANKFRSAPEFFEHASWLFDIERPISDHTQCGCKYNNKSDLARTKRSSFVASSPGAGPSKRLASSPLKSSAKKRRSQSPSSEPEPTGVVPDRAQDLQHGRRFRRGELVWFRIDTISPPASNDGNGTLPSITHWPGLVSQIELKSRVIPLTSALGNGEIANSTLRAAYAITGATPPASVQPTGQEETVRWWQYRIRPLGLFNSNEDVIKDIKDLLPYAVGDELLGGEGGWDAIGNEGTRIIAEGVAVEAKEYQALAASGKPSSAPLDELWKAKWARRIKFSEMPKKWETVVFRLAMALKTGFKILNSWSQTDRIDVLPEMELNPEDKADLLSQKRTLYQGLWWGGERIWVDDMVRLKKDRAELPTDQLLPPSPGAEDKAVFLKIRAIALEVSPDNGGEKVTTWRCLLYGDVFELAPTGYSPDEDIFLTPLSTTPGQGLDLVGAYRAPKTFKYRQLNAAGMEVTCDIIDVAGRCYPDLLEYDTQNWFVDPTRSVEENKGRVIPGVVSRAISGMASGRKAYSKSDDWQEDLYVIVSTATKSVESDMKKFYGDLLEKSGWKSPVPKDDTGKVPTKAPRASGAGQSASMATNGGPGASAVMNAAAVAGKAVTAGA